MIRAPVTHPLLYQVNTRAWLYERGRALERPATLDDVTDAWLDTVASDGFDWVWLLGVWQTGEAGRGSRSPRPNGRRSITRCCPTSPRRTCAGSPFAIRGYVVHAIRRPRRAGPVPGPAGGPRHPAHARLRAQPHRARSSLGAHASRVSTSRHGPTSAREPHNYVRVPTTAAPACWPTGATRTSRAGPTPCRSTTATRPPGGDARERCGHRGPVRRGALRHGDAGAARRVRAHLGRAGAARRRLRPRRFLLAACRRARAPAPPGFVFMAEAYWDLEWALQQQGFDFTYDKRLYDRLHGQDAGAVRGHLHAAAEYQRRSARFLENHDEPRAAAAWAPAVHSGGGDRLLRPVCAFIHEGQRRDGGCAPATTCDGGRPSPSTASGRASTVDCSRACDGPRSGTATGRCSSRTRRGPAIQPGSASSRSSGRAPATGSS